MQQIFLYINDLKIEFNVEIIMVQLILKKYALIDMHYMKLIWTYIMQRITGEIKCVPVNYNWKGDYKRCHL